MLPIVPLLAAALLQTAPEGCRKCEHRGVVDCSKHSAEERQWEQEVPRCSVAARCAPCGGSLLVDCPKCEGGPLSAEMEQRRQAAAAWLAQEDPLETHLQRPLARAETLHFRLVVDVVALKDGKKKVDGHAFLHWVARDLERAAALQDGHYGAVAADRRSPSRMWLWQRREDHAAVMEKFLFSTSSGDFKMLGRDPVFSVWTADPQFEDAAPRLHSLAIHNGAHLLLSNLFRELWVGDLGAGWLDEGAGHWYEDKVIGRSTNYCVDETGIPSGGIPDMARSSIRTRLERSKDAVLPGLLRRQSGELSADEHAYAFSFYDWVSSEHRGALAPLLRGYHSRRSSSELLPEALGFNVFQLEEAWRAWVTKSYPATEPKPRRYERAPAPDFR
ncbi:MAG: hypothetical protein EYC70_14870 [Planctomycetota bacterium]|nr:MAG: hypothetical protein EYC70_14870 [Planctomycetota bacterium]